MFWTRRHCGKMNFDAEALPIAANDRVPKYARRSSNIQSGVHDPAVPDIDLWEFDKKLPDIFMPRI